MAAESCLGNAGWSALDGAQADSTLAGVLAGFLIAAAVALLMQWYDRSGPRRSGYEVTGMENVARVAASTLI